jgi:hypothetical protein
LIGMDTNHVGDSRFLNTPAALKAISATNTGFGCGAGTDAAAINCAIAAGATIFDYAGHGLDSGNAYNSGFSPYVFGRTPDTGATFGGQNPNVGTNQMLLPIGRSVYNALQMKLTSQLTNPAPGVKSINAQVSYAYSRAVASVKDVDFIANAYDFRNPGLSGPNGLDRTHQFSAGATFNINYGPELSFITHWNSPLPADIKLATPASPVGAIYTSDLTGDGSFAGSTSGASGDLLPGTKPGGFGRDFGVGGLAKLINDFNANIAGQTLTPAGQALVDANLFSKAQLLSLGATPQRIAPPPPGEVGLAGFFSFDLRLGWNLRPVRKWEQLQISPQINIYNLFNHQNYDSPSLPLSGTLNGAPGFLNGTTAHDQAGCPADPTKCTGRTNLVGLGSGVFALGAPRSLEFGFRVIF